MITYRTPKQGITTKAQLAKINPEMAAIRPMTRGRVFYPLPLYKQSGHRLDEIIEDVAAILHPELYPGHHLKFFRELR